MQAQRELVVEISGAEKSYGKRRALQGIDLELYRGELLGFLGPNGAGKTTLIRSLAGRSRLDNGEIVIHDTAHPNARGKARQSLIGFVPQSLAIYGDLTVQQNLDVFGRLHGVHGAHLRQRIETALTWAKLEDRTRQLAGTLSGGMQRRLNIACSILHQPTVLLLDEPTVGVDPQSRERIYEMLDELRGQGTGILLTTHQLDEAQFRCDRIAIVDQGKVIRLGTLDQLIQETVGPQQNLSVHFKHAQASVPAPLKLSEDGMHAECSIEDLTNELEGIIRTLSDSNVPIEQMTIQAPTLQQVFLHLTGRELRE